MAKLKWTVTFEVDESWVADGFVMTGERAKDMLAQDLCGAYGHELGAKVVSAPDPTRIAKLQGYKTAADLIKSMPGHKLGRGGIIKSKFD